MRTPLPAVACVVSFIDAVNHGDVDRLAALLTEDHRLQVLDEAPLDGRAANVEAWRGYAAAFPDYVIYPEHIVADGEAVVVLGHSTGSHVGLPDADERELPVIWRAVVRAGRLARWQVLADTPERRAHLGLRPD